MRRCIQALGLIVALSGMASGTTYVVTPDGTGDFPTIQAAVDYAVDYDIIELTDGTFTGNGNRDIDYQGKSITVKSQTGDPQVCIIDCQGSETEPHRGFHFHNGEGQAAILQGISVTNGWGLLNPHDYFEAGAVLCVDASPTITGCCFSGNTAEFGGAIIFCGSGSPILTNCTFSGNTADFQSASILCRDTSAPTVTDCLFEDNHAHHRGSGLLADDTSRPVVLRCTFVRNSSLLGAGAHCCGESICYFGQCTFEGNAAPIGGAGICCSCFSTTFIEQCLIAFSTEGNGVDCGTNAIVELSCCDIYGNAGGDWVGPIESQYGIAGNFSEDPLFCNPANDDLTLYRGSPCLPGHHPNGDDCGLIGAWPIGCPSSAVEDERSVTPLALLKPNAPNPFALSTVIAYEVPATGPRAQGLSRVRLGIYDAGGRMVRTLVDALQPLGLHTVSWDGTNSEGGAVEAGVYFYHLSVHGEELTKRMVVFK